MEVTTTSAPLWLHGAWERPLLRVGGHDDVTTVVRYVQTPSRFGDLRIPATRPARLRGRTLDRLDDRELFALAEQQGFAGHATAEGRVVTWSRAIDYQPPSRTPDVGLVVCDDPDTLTEHGVHAAYLERWTRLAADTGTRIALERAAATGVPRAILVLSGDHFVFARDRAEPLPAGAPSLLDCCRDAIRADRLRWLDCELSWGHAGDGTIELSTLPDREGAPLFDPPWFRGVDGDEVVDALGARWRLLDGDVGALRSLGKLVPA